LKRKDLIKHLEQSGCIFVREGKKHTVYSNPKKKRISTIPRHVEIHDLLVRKICKDLDVTQPK